MKSKIFYTQLFGILIIVLIVLIAVPRYKDSIPKELVKRIQNRLQENKIDWVAVRAKDRDITVSGVAPSIELHQKVVDITKQTIGVRRVKDNISPTVITPYSMNISYKKGDEVSFSGYMPSKDSMENLFKIVDIKLPKLKITKRVDIGAGEPIEWEKLISVLSLILQDLELATINVVDTKVSISGKCQNSEQRDKIVESLQRFRSRGFDIQQRIIAMDESKIICQNKFNTLLSEQKILFKVGKSKLKPQNETLLKNLVDISLLCSNTKIDIVGHTDSKGNQIKNQELSLSRAKAVVAKLFELGIPLDRMRAIGRGSKEPIADNNTDEGRAINRRIEFRVKGY